jgi:hypothetical protein
MIGRMASRKRQGWRRKPTNRTKGLVALCAAGLLVAGCGSSAKSAAPKTTSPTTTPSPTTAPSTTTDSPTTSPTTTTSTPPGSPSTTAPGSSTTTKGSKPTTPAVSTAPLPTSVPNNIPERKDVTLQQCAAVPGGWGASGVAANPGTTPVSYKITVYFTDTKATTLDYAQTTVTVPAGKTQPWTANKTFAPVPSKVLCVLVGVG